jgi:hypothetical protein
MSSLTGNARQKGRTAHDKRITRTYWLRVPKYRTGHRERTNWSLVRLSDAVPLVVIAYRMPSMSGVRMAAFFGSVAWSRAAWPCGLGGAAR